jgi:hypothetical protein
LLTAFIDELKKYGVRMYSAKEYSDWIEGSGLWADSDSGVWTRSTWADGSDYHLQASSPAIDAGRAISGLTSDYVGTPVPQGIAPDIGAYEYQNTGPAYVLNIRFSGSGSGSVTYSANGSQVTCLGGCSPSFPGGTVVTLTGSPISGNSYNGWSGACSCLGECVVTMNTPMNVTVTFQPLTVNVTANVNGGVGGSVTGTGMVNYGDPDTFTIVPEPGYNLSALTDNGVAVTSTPVGDGTYTYTISSVTFPHTIQATFTPTNAMPVPALGTVGMLVTILIVSILAVSVRKVRTDRS